MLSDEAKLELRVSLKGVTMIQHSEDLNLSSSIKHKARELGFNICGIAKSRTLEEHGAAALNRMD